MQKSPSRRSVNQKIMVMVDVCVEWGRDDSDWLVQQNQLNQLLAVFDDSRQKLTKFCLQPQN